LKRGKKSVTNGKAKKRARGARNAGLGAENGVEKNP